MKRRSFVKTSLLSSPILVAGTSIQESPKPTSKYNYQLKPTTGEINYKNIFKYIYSQKFDGILGMEHGNFTEGKKGEIAVIKAYQDVDKF